MRESLKGAVAPAGRTVAMAIVVLGLFGCPGQQIPVDIKPAFWVTLFDGQGLGVVGYVLVTGRIDAGELITSKGTFEIAPMTEQWFSANNPQVALEPHELDTLVWDVQVAEGDSWDQELKKLIETSDGLVDNEGSATGWELRAPAGIVPWDRAEASDMEGLATFEWRDRAIWYLGVARDDDGLSRVVWGTSRSPGVFELPAVFGQATSTALERTETATPTAVFSRHQVASP